MPASILALVALHQPAGAQQITLIDEPLAIVGLSENAPIGHVLAAHYLEGKLLVVDGMTRELLSFDPETGTSQTLLTRGEGPKELSNPRNSWVLGDTLFIYDSGTRKVIGVSASGDLLLDQRMRIPIPVGELRSLSDGGWLLVPRFRFTNEATGLPGRDTLSYFTTARDFSSPSRLATTPGIMGDRITIEGRNYHRLAPFSPFPKAMVWGECTFIGVTDQAHLRVFSSGGSERSRVDLARRTARPVDDVLKASFVNALVDLVSENEQAGFRRAADDLSFPSVLPGFITFQIDPRGLLWIQEYDPFEFSDTWLIQTLDGSVVQELHLPMKLEVHQIGNDFIVGSGRDEQGRPFVVLLGLEAPRLTTRLPDLGCRRGLRP